MQKKLDSKETKSKLSKYEVLDTCFYKEVSGVISKYRKHINNTINFDLVLANWEIGKMIDEKQNSLPRAEYGEKLIKELSSQMTKDFGKGYTESNLKYMRMFYKTFNIRHALRDQLSWTHYRLLLSVKYIRSQDAPTKVSNCNLSEKIKSDLKVTFVMRGCAQLNGAISLTSSTSDGNTT